MNVFYSEIIDVIPSDSLALSKRNARRFKYVELRILAYLRNKNFNLERFEEFVEHLNEKDVAFKYRMTIKADKTEFDLGELVKKCHDKLGIEIKKKGGTIGSSFFLI